MDLQKVIIYTDGGCEPNPGIGGWGVVLIRNGIPTKISGGEPETTNNRMELTAACQALKVLTEPHAIDLYTDSQYLKNGITDWIEGWKRKNWRDVKNVDLWRELDVLVQQHTIVWHWVKGHAGNRYNELVDQLAMAEIRRLAAISRSSVLVLDDTALSLFIAADTGDQYVGQGGWAVVFIENGTTTQLSGREAKSSKPRLILSAAIEALESEMCVSARQIQVFTDFDYLTKGMTTWLGNWKQNNWRTKENQPVKNVELWRRLDQLNTGKKIDWNVVRLEDNNQYHHLARSLASRSRLSSD